MLNSNCSTLLLLAFHLERLANGKTLRGQLWDRQVTLRCASPGLMLDISSAELQMASVQLI